MRVSRIAAVLALSVLVGTGWLLTEAYPSELAFPFAGCIHFAVIALAGAIGAHWKGCSRARIAAIATAGAAIFALPGVVGALTAGAVSESASVALFCAVPLLIVLGRASFGDGSGRGLLIPSLLGLFGALLIFSVELPGSVRRATALAAVFVCCVVIAAASIWIFKLMQGVQIAVAVSVVGIAGAVLSGCYGLAVGLPHISTTMLGFEMSRCLVFDLPVVWITVWLMREVPPSRLASRFLLAPVITWLEGYAMVRGPIEFRSMVALVLMVTGAMMLLIMDESEEIPGLHLR